MERRKTNLDMQFPPIKKPERILLGPGPSMVDPRVLNAMSIPLLGHLDPLFIELMNRIQSQLKHVFQTENALTIPVSGTGSAAMEAAVANMVEPGDPILVCKNGYFSDRLADMAARYGGIVSTIVRPWGDVFTPQDIKSALAEKPARIVAIVHAETSTGALQPLDEIAKIVHDHGAVLIVDAVTSLGGVPVRVDEIGIDVCYSATQKCLGCPPGLGPITLNSRAVEKLTNRKSIVANWYLDLTLVQKYWGSERSYHHTAPISANYGLYEGLRIIMEETLEARWKRHQTNAEFLWQGLEEIGLECAVPLNHRLPSLTVVHIPEGIDDLTIRRQLLEKYNIEIAGGLGEYKGKVWRIGLMGYSSNREYITLLLDALKGMIRP
ncbi:pyridoxal-phosphate-dependent aminotransferase family protein [Chloroflexota bacterium]